MGVGIWNTAKGIRNPTNDWNPVKKCTLFECQCVSTKVLIGDTILTTPTGDRTAILRGHPSHAKVSPFAGQR